MTLARTLIAIAALAAVWLAMLLLGTGQADRALLIALHADQPWLQTIAIALTMLGNWPTLVAAALAGAAWLAWRGRVREALLLLAVTLSGRLAIILQKEWFARLRPEETLQLVEVHYKSFPSGHAGNSMITLMVLALSLAPPRHRPSAITAAVLLSIAIGLSRPMLGVHWPSDIVAGWAFGLLWALLAYTLKRNSNTSPSATT
jgi:undecaprenyl-diphosphatase